MEENELKESQTNLFIELNDIQGHNEEIVKLSDQIRELKGQYNDTEHAFERIMHWKLVIAQFVGEV
jgi:predicted  nucleic acid-binding Zn-ribbon protein